MMRLLLLLATFLGLGNPFIGIGPKDTGYCGLAPYGGYGWDGNMAWPTDMEVVIRENRHFRQGHTGLDLDMPLGSPVLAADDGVVVFAGWSTWGFGNLVVIAHGGFQTMYAHLSDVSVSCGRYVLPGALLGHSGRTGAATWPHLHFEVRDFYDGHPRAHDPLQFLPHIGES